MTAFSLRGAVLALATFAASAGEEHALKNAVVLIIRHAERPDDGSGLAPAGEKRAEAYVQYFKSFTVDGQPCVPDELICAADSKESKRPRLTLEPLSKALGLKIEHKFKDKDYEQQASDLHHNEHGKCILICWHHGEIPSLLQALGAGANALVPDGKWPNKEFGWVIQLRFDANGHVAEAKRIEEKLTPDDGK